MDGSYEAGRLLLTNGKRDIWMHSQAVAAEIRPIAQRYALDAELCVTAALCHDIGGILAPRAMREKALAEGIVLDPAEERYPFLLHQRFSAKLCAERLGIAEEAILSAVGCHTTLKAEAAPVDMAVFIADKLAWDQEGRPPYEEEVRRALEASLEAACLAYMDHTLAHGMILMPHRWLLEAHAWLNGKGR